MDRPQFSVESIQGLVNEYNGLRTFAAAVEWDKRAQAEIDTIAAALDRLDAYERSTKAEIVAAQQERESKNAVARMLHNRSAEKALEADLKWVAARRSDLEEIADKLQELMDYTPADDAERKSILKELKIDKKDLQIQKREVTAEMRAVRTEARQQSAQLESFGVRSLSKIAAGQRRNIRRRKEAALGPSENAKAAIERQLVAIERRIVWLERFGSD